MRMSRSTTGARSSSTSTARSRSTPSGPLMDIVFRGIVVFVFLYALMRIMGRRELSTFEPFDLILLIILGDAVQQGLTQDDYSLTGAMLAVGTIAILQVGTSFLNFHLPRLRPLLDGEPIVVVQD